MTVITKKEGKKFKVKETGVYPNVSFQYPCLRLIKYNMRIL